MTIEMVLRDVSRSFQQKKISNPLIEAEQLLTVILKMNWGELMLAKREKFPNQYLDELSNLVARRLRGEPLAYIQGFKHFYENDFFVDSDVLIPRPETELIIEKSIELRSIESVKNIFDIGCGSGCLGLSLGKVFLSSRVHLFDISSKAILITEKNIESLGLINRAKAYHGEINESPHQLTALKGKVDLVVANPPYISRDDLRLDSSVREFEPDSALFAHSNGMEWIEKWLLWSYFYLASDGLGIFEFGQGQEKKVIEAVENADLQLVEIVRDYSQIDRHVIFKKGN